MKTKMLARRSEQGVALLTTMVIVIIVGGLAAAFLTLSFSQSSVIAQASDSEMALNVAEAGIDDMLNKLSAYAVDYVSNGNKPMTYTSPGPDYAIIANASPSFTGSMNKGTFTTTLGNSTNTSPAFVDPWKTFVLYSVGTFNQRTRGIEVITAAVDKSNLFKYGLFGDVEVEAGGNFTSDGFDSASGTYASQPKLTHTWPDGKTTDYVKSTGNLGSNGNITVSGTAQIMGNATPGPGGSTSGGGNVYGSTTPAPAVEAIAPVSYPSPVPGTSWSWSNGDAALVGGALGTPIEYKASDLNPSGKGTLTVTGEVILYVDGDFNMNNQQSLNIAVGAKLTIKQGPGTGGITINGQAISGTASADRFQVYSASSGEIKFNGGSEVYAAVYAPKMTFTNNGGNEFYGAMVAGQMKLKGTASFHYDENLAKLSTPKPTFTILSWREVTK